MKKWFRYKKTMAFVAVLAIVFFTLDESASAKAVQAVKLLINQTMVISQSGSEMTKADIMNPIGVIGEKMGVDVNMDGVTGSEVPAVSTAANEQNSSSATTVNKQAEASRGSSNNKTSPPANVTNPTSPVNSIPSVTPTPSQNVDPASITIRGSSVATADQLRKLLKANNPSAPDLVNLYLEYGRKYGIRGDIAFCQAAKETGWWRFGGIVKPWQNNYCGLGATGTAATGTEDLRGADPNLVSYQYGVHGCIFASQAAGVEAHIQHLYAYTGGAVPAHLLDPRFTLVTWIRAKYWVDLNGRWAVPGTTYGQSIINDYYMKALAL